jgi:hypothetical protein
MYTLIIDTCTKYMWIKSGNINHLMWMLTFGLYYRYYIPPLPTMVGYVCPRRPSIIRPTNEPTDVSRKNCLALYITNIDIFLSVSADETGSDVCAVSDRCDRNNLAYTGIRYLVYNIVNNACWYIYVL